jgi:hypothetical protein
MVACLRHTASSWGDVSCCDRLETNKGTNGWDSQEHDDELFLAEDGVPDEGIQEPRQTAAALLDKGAVVGEVVAVDWTCQQ